MYRTFQLLGALLCILVLLAVPTLAAGSQYNGQVTFGGYPVPGATVTLTQGTRKLSAISDQGGLFSFTDLSDEASRIKIEMQCFATIEAALTVTVDAPTKWELKLLPLDQLTAFANQKPKPPPALNSATPAEKPTKTQSLNGSAPDIRDIPKPQEDLSQEPSDGLLVNGSVNNAATSRFSLDQAFGNKRSSSKGRYTGGLVAILDNSALDARSYSLSGVNTPKAPYTRTTGGFTLGGPLKIPHVLEHGPIFSLAYQWTREHVANTESARVPSQAERAGDFAGLQNSTGQPIPIFNPATGQPFPGNIVPVSPQALALLQLYPLPNLENNPLYNYQVGVLNSTHQDALQSRLDKTLGRKDELYGNFNFQSTRADDNNLFGFTDSTEILGIDARINWAHRFSQHLFIYGDYRFSRLRTRITPYFENRQNVSGTAGISGNNQDPSDWGPPSLGFSSGIAPLKDVQNSFNRSRTDAFSGSVARYHGRHNITLGGDFRKQQFNDFFQQDPRGTFTFTGGATQDPATSGAAGGSDFADFLIGVPDTSSIAFGNPDKYLRQAVYDAYAMDDWRILPMLTINGGVRWEYGAPITELHDRLVNLDVAPSFRAVAPVLGTDPVGPLTGNRYPNSLVRPDRLGFAPRIGISWRPFSASTVVVRAGYGIYHDTSVYQTAALGLAQQAPFSKSLNVQNSDTCPLTLANGFNPCSTTTSNSFAVDPDFHVGYAQTWQLAIQRDLPMALQLTTTYLGVKGTRGLQQFLPNTYPIGGLDPCPSCPSGFVYQISGGNSTREAGQIQLRRRLRSGLTASLLYTYSKSIDDDAQLGGLGHINPAAQAQGSTNSTSATAPTAPVAELPPTIAQDWLNLRAERSLSSFDQRHLLNLQIQYTSGEGLGGGTLMSGRVGKLLKGWTVLTKVAAGTGLPETPTYLATVPGTGFTGSIRPDVTGSSISSSQEGIHLNPAAYTAPTPGQWGTAARNSITGPSQLSLDSALARTFQASARFYLDARVDATNLLNHGVFTGWNTTINSTQFGLPIAVNPMRSLQVTLRLRF